MIPNQRMKNNQEEKSRMKISGKDAGERSADRHDIRRDKDFLAGEFRQGKDNYVIIPELDNRNP